MRPFAGVGGLAAPRDKLEQFQQKCEAVLRPELRQNNEIDRFGVSVKL
jgi:hypothetical protein